MALRQHRHFFPMLIWILKMLLPLCAGTGELSKPPANIHHIYYCTCMLHFALFPQDYYLSTLSLWVSRVKISAFIMSWTSRRTKVKTPWRVLTLITRWFLNTKFLQLKATRWPTRPWFNWKCSWVPENIVAIIRWPKRTGFYDWKVSTDNANVQRKALVYTALPLNRWLF